MNEQTGSGRPRTDEVRFSESSTPRPTIITKIRIPRRRPDLLPRQRLVDFLHSNLERRLVLISAPAGYGKTSLLTDFSHSTDLPVCWYTLDSFDCDLRVFLEHFVAAITHRFPSYGQRSASFLQETADLGRNLYPIVATIVQEIYDTIPEYFFLILDDHHTVEEQEQINEFLDLFVTYIDENCHLLLASRTLPALPNLSLLVARRQAAGLSIDELRFTPEEIQALASQNYGLTLSLEQAEKLADRTGGWITGLLLTTAQEWQQTQQEAGILGRINVDVYDYLSQQVLERQPLHLRDFLLESSVLDELGPDLCRTVLGIDQPARWLNKVRTRNLFFIDFEGDASRLRYHDLFREFLQDTLRQQDEARFRELTMRAADAYADRQEWERAVSRYLDLQQYDAVVNIIQIAGAEMFNRGRWDTLASWIDALPQQVRSAHPDFLMHRGKIHMERGEYDTALDLYEQAEQAYRMADRPVRQAYAMGMKGYVLRFQGLYPEAIGQCQQVLALIDGDTPEEQTTLALVNKNIGLCWFRRGKLERGHQALQQALRLYEQIDAPYDMGMIFHDLGVGHELMGDLEGALTYYQAALERWQQLGNPAPWANTLNSLGVLYVLQGRYDRAQQTLEQALAKTQKAGDVRVEAYVWASLGDLHADLAAYKRARQAYTQAQEIAGRARVGFVPTYALNALGNISRLQGKLSQAQEQLGQAMKLAQSHHSDYEIGLCHSSLGILAYTRKDLTEARSHLDQAIELFEAGGFRRELALAFLHRAQSAFLVGEAAAALADLQRALDLAEQLGFAQFLVVEGQSLLPLLQFAQDQALAPDFLPGLLQQISSHKDRLDERPEPAVEVAAPPSLHIYALGAPQVKLDGQRIQWPTTQSRDLFFCLLQHRHGLRKEEVGGLLWPDYPPNRLDGIFRSTLYRLRRAVFRESILYEDGYYRFNRASNYWHDVEALQEFLDQAEQEVMPERRIEQLEQALELYRGDYLEGVYADWCVLEREQLREQRLSALESLAGLLARQRNFRQAIDCYQELIALDSYREPAHRELMRCYYRLGDRVSAVRQYQSCVEILREDLGLSPTRETEILYLEIIG